MTRQYKLLIIKTSSLGDVIHMLPAISDALSTRPDLQIDWVVEEGFAEVPRWHPGIRRVIPVALRRWRKQLGQRQTWADIQQFWATVRQERYDWIVDTQGLLKSALLTRMAHGKRYGYDRHSSREPLASYAYQHRAAIAYPQHAVTRNRLLLAFALEYNITALPVDYGLTRTTFPPPPLTLPRPYCLAFHGTSRVDKEWGEHQWRQLLTTLAQQRMHTLLPWGNTREHERTMRLQQQTGAYTHILPRCSLSQLAGIVQQAHGIIGMDTGLMHLAAALDKPSLALYPVTAPALTGLLGNTATQCQPISISGDNTQHTTLVIADFLQQMQQQTQASS